jgi:GNAT superfamily N-acetyltransferase
MTLVITHTYGNLMTSVIPPQVDWRRHAAGPRPGGGEPRFDPLTADDEPAVSALLARCSRITLYRRFHSFTDGRAYARGLFTRRAGYYTLVARCGPLCIGLGDLALGASGTADLGVLVEDAWQRRGIGTRLISALLDAARSQGAATAHADVLDDGQFLLRALHQAGPLTVSWQTGTFSVDIDLRSSSGSVR